MKIQINNFSPRTCEFGYVASFDVHIEGGFTLRSIALCRPQENPEQCWLTVPALARENRQSVGIAPEMRRLIGERAAAVYRASTGISLTYTPLPENKAKPAARARVIQSNWCGGERADAGLRRMIGETMQIAGL